MPDQAQRPSIAARLGITLALLFVTGGIAVSLAALAYGRAAADRSYDRLLIGAANEIALATAVRNGKVEIDIPVAAFELLALAPEDRIVYAVFAPDGRLLTGYEGIAPGPGDAKVYAASFTGEPARFAVATRQFAERSFSGTVRVVVGQTVRARLELAREITRGALALVGTAGLLMSVLAVLAVRSALRPLSRIERGLARRSPRDLTEIAVAVPREVGGLVDALNRFMSRIDRQLNTMRILIADASHQLRTPVAAIRAQAELAADEPDPAVQREIVGRIHRRSVTLGRLTDQLLSHAMIIHRADAVPRQRIDLRGVAMRAVAETDHDLLVSDIELGLDLAEEDVAVAGDAMSLAEACKNLIGNALRHGVPPVTVRVAREGDRAVLAVRDLGAGLPEDQWRDAARRFASRSGVSPSSAGLGLAIAQSVARAHDGALRFRKTEEGGFEVRIIMPILGGPGT